MGDSYEQIEIQEHIPEESSGTIGKIACCGRYLACSDAKRCINPDNSIASQCIYRSNLEAGRIFYGRNRADFVVHEYEEYVCRMNKLSDSSRELFDSIVHAIVGEFRNSLLLYSSSDIEEIEKANLLIIEHPTVLSCAKGILTFYKTNALKNAIAEFDPELYIKYKEDFKKYKQEQSGESKSASMKERPFMIDWLLQNAPEIVQRFSCKYVYVKNPEHPYAIQYYLENKLGCIFQKLNYPSETDSNFIRSGVKL